MSGQFVFNVRHELASADLAYAVALDAEIERDSRVARAVYIGSLAKDDITGIGRARVVGCGPPHMWPAIEDKDLIRIARERVTQLWGVGS